MKYNIITIPDIHWGVINPYEQLKQLEFIIQFIKECKEQNIKIHMIIIAGDYFDSKLPLNSREAIFAIQWMNRLYDTAIDNGVLRIRVIHGTLEHDNDQLDVFKPMERPKDYVDEDYFKVITKTTSEEVFSDLKVIYCPDETIQTSEYEETYLNEILSGHDIGFFHGSFDVVYGELLEVKPDLMEKKNVIFRYDLWNKVIKGPMIAGHWHDGKQYDDLYYCGSPFRWAFGEDEEKGIGFLHYDTEDNSYYYQKIKNCMACDYVTYSIYTNMYNTKEDFRRAFLDIDDIRRSFLEIPHRNHKLRIMVYIVDEKPENDVFISSLRHKILNHKNVKIVIKNKLKDKLKKETAKKNKERDDKYKFLYNEEKHPPEVIYDFIQSRDKNANVPIEFIRTKISQYIKG